MIITKFDIMEVLLECNRIEKLLFSFCFVVLKQEGLMWDEDLTRFFMFVFII